MGKIIISTNASLDGVVQDPDGKEGFGRGGWFGEFGGRDLEEWAKVSLDEALGTEAVLLGRRSDEWFAARWAGRTGEWADRLNGLAEVAKLKQDLAGDIVVYASYQLGQALLEHDLVDELRLVVFPVVLGAGQRLFGETREQKPMRLIDTKTIGDGLAFFTYELVREG